MFFNSCFIWTDCLGNPNNVINELNYFINTFDNLKLNVFTFEEDIYLLPQHKNIIYHKFPKTNFIIDLINQFFGHIFLKNIQNIHYLFILIVMRLRVLVNLFSEA